MFMKKQGGGGSRFTFPLETRMRLPGAEQEMISPAWFSHLGMYWFYEDFLGDSYDVTASPLAIYDGSDGDTTPSTGVEADQVGGAFGVALSADPEAHAVGFTLGDQLNIRGDKPFLFACRVKITAAVAANETFVFGLGSNVSNDLDGMDRYAWFRLQDDTDLLVEAKDGSETQTGLDTGMDVTPSSYLWLAIENGHDGRLYFRVADGDGDHVRTFNLKDHFGGFEVAFGANNLQPLLLVKKASGATTPKFVVDVIAFAGARG